MNDEKTNTNTAKEPDIFEQIELEYEKQSEYLKLKDGEVRILEFDPDTKRIRLVDSKFNGSKRVEYIVRDRNRPSIGEKKFQTGMNYGRQIGRYLQKGRTVLEIERIGSDIKTRYNISAQ